MNDSSARSRAAAVDPREIQPNVSVILPFLNRGRYLRESIQSVLEQCSDVPLELLLVDDGSEDDSLRIALDLAEAAPRTVRILRHPGGENRGTSVSRNLALRHARAPFVTFLDADDIWLPGALQTQLAAFERFPEADMVFGAAERWCDLSQPFDEAAARAAWWGKNYIPPVIPEGASPGLLPLGALLDWYLADESKVPCICSVMVRTSVACAVGGFEEQFRGLYDDQAFHAKVALAYPVVAHEACLARYLQHPECGSPRRRQPATGGANPLHHLAGTVSPVLGRPESLYRSGAAANLNTSNRGSLQNCFESAPAGRNSCGFVVKMRFSTAARRSPASSSCRSTTGISRSK